MKDCSCFTVPESPLKIGRLFPLKPFGLASNANSQGVNLILKVLGIATTAITYSFVLYLSKLSLSVIS
jgi:hypothetical protein